MKRRKPQKKSENSQYPARSELAQGMDVTISVGRGDGSASGKISEILTSAENHPHGIMVLLDEGSKGRVVEIHGSPASPPGSDFDLEEALKDESQHIEYKASAAWTRDKEKLSAALESAGPESKLARHRKNYSRYIYSRAVASFMNSGGGNLLLGVTEDKASGRNLPTGIEVDYPLIKEPGTDAFRREINDGLGKFLPSSVVNNLRKHLSIEMIPVDDRTICRIEVWPSAEPIFLKFDKAKDDEFWIRVETSSKQLEGSELAEFIRDNF